MTTATEQPAKRRRGRSPSYPGISIDEALQRAKSLYDQDGQSPGRAVTVLAHWGYGPKSGRGLVVLAALSKYGLIDDQGVGEARRIKVSALAKRILLDQREDSSERRRLIQEAALAPPIHREIWDECGGALPSDENLRHSLIFDRGFTESGASDFTQQFRQTVEFADLRSGTIPVDHKDDPPEKQPPDDQKNRSRKRVAGVSVLSFNVGRIVDISVEGDDLSGDELEALADIVEAQQKIVARREAAQPTRPEVPDDKK